MKKVIGAAMALAVLGFAADSIAGAGCGAAHGMKAVTAKSCCGGCGGGAAKAADAGCKSGVCAATGVQAAAVSSPEKIAEISTAALQTLVRSGAAGVVLDARSGKWYDGQRIPGAVQVGTEPSQEQLDELIKSKDALVVTYCSNTKCPASDKLAKYLVGLGYSNVLEYPEGIAGWLAAGNSVESDEKVAAN